MSVNEKMTAIADAIRSKTGKTGKLGLEDMAQAIEQMGDQYDQGVGDGKAAILNGIDGLYMFFANGQNMALLPHILADMTRFTNMQYAFRDNSALTEFHAPETMYVTAPHYMFQRCSNLVTVSGLDRAVGGVVLNGLFDGCTSLVDAGTINFEGVTYMSSTFVECTALQEVRIAGTIGVSLDIHWSTKLTRASIESIITHLSDTATGQTLTLSAAAVDREFGYYEDGELLFPGSEDEPWSILVDSKPNWTISLV